ncbi:3-dehydroquinate synthase [Bernardetia sp. Wsw4-3y2]|uniref:3-dehydroquinate synthase n=1 Tax=Bernardetia sp. Wsw4-3y2 TaxID=3127471 RepID=UPI0030CB2C26
MIKQTNSLPTYITFEPLEKIISLLQNKQVAVLVDENTKRDCYPILDKVFEKAKLQKPLLIEIPSGETNKTLETCTHIWYELTQNHFDRKAILINLGGGVIGDMGGFCASTYKRGIDFIQIPTTLLSQVDASVGGKLGIDFNGFKNHIGIFQTPSKVWIHSPFLKTLPQNEMRSGFAEVIKHTLIADKKAWQKLLDDKDIIKNSFENQSEIDIKNELIDKIVAHSVALKAKVTEADPTEKGLRKILNFGHTIGHAIESYFIEENIKESKKGTITKPVFLHGEAIALGMIAESYFSAYLCKELYPHQTFISENDFVAIRNYINSIFEDTIIDFRKAIQTENTAQKITEWAKQDKKNAQNTILTCALEEIGKATFDISISEIQILECLKNI